MGVTSNAVEIRINVVDENSGQAVGQVTKNVESLGSAGAGSGEKVAAGMDKIRGHSLTALDNVRLLRDDIGIRIPRSMEKAIASSQAMMSVIGAFGNVLLGIGAIDIGIRIGKGLYDAYEKWISLGAAAEAYQEQVDKMKDEDFINVHDIETATARIKEAKTAAQDYLSTAQVVNKLGWGMALMGDPTIAATGYATLYQARKTADEGYKKKSQADALRGPQAAENHQAILNAIELDKIKAEKLRPEQRAVADRGFEHATDEENRKYDAAVQGQKGNMVPADAGASKQHQQDALADAKADVQLFNLRREQGIELQHMREAALEAGLRGSKLYAAQEAAAIAELKNKDIDSVAFRKAVHDKFHAEQLRRLQDEERETEKIERAAAAAGSSGIGKTRAEGEERVAGVRDEEFMDTDAGGHSAQAERRRKALRDETDAQILESERQFTDRLNALVDENAAHQAAGFARIEADRKKAIDSWQQEFQKQYPGSADQDQHAGELQRGITAINAGAGEQSVDLARKNAEETGQLESEARAKFLSAESQQTAAIETQYEQRLRKFQEELNQQEISQQDYDRRAIAAAQLRDAELVENAKRAREKMAGEFTSFFHSMDHPIEALKSLGDKAAGQAAAAMVQRMQMHVSGSTLPATQPTGIAGGNLWDKLMGRVAGQPIAHSTTSAHAAVPGIEHAPPDLGSVKAITLSTAEIHIQSANFAFSGGASATAGSASPISSRGGAGVAGENSFGGSGSTSLAAPPGSSFTVPEAGASSMGHGGGAITPGAPSSTGVSSYASEAGTIASGAAGASGSTAVATGAGNVERGLGLVKQARGVFGTGGSTVMQGGPFGGLLGGGDISQGGGLGDSGMPNLAGIFGPAKTASVTGPSNAGMLGGGGIAANAGGFITGGMGLFGAYEGNGGIGGTLSGAMSGMQLGMSVGGPIGAAIGAVGGAILGAIGFGGREKARVYDLKTVRPRLGNDFEAYQTGSMDYSSAYSDMQALDVEARGTLDKMGGSARAYYWDTVNGEIKRAEAKLTAEEKAGRSQVTMSAAQYDQGGWTGDFGSMATGPDSGFAHMRANEFVVHEQPAAAHAGALEAIRAGASHEDMARYYGGGSEAKMPAQGGFGGEVHLHYNLLDASGVRGILSRHKHDVRDALNAARAENSGGSDFA